jgi:hypothetical protein
LGLATADLDVGRLSFLHGGSFSFLHAFKCSSDMVLGQVILVLSFVTSWFMADSGHIDHPVEYTVPVEEWDEDFWAATAPDLMNGLEEESDPSSGVGTLE